MFKNKLFLPSLLDKCMRSEFDLFSFSFLFDLLVLGEKNMLGLMTG